MKRLITAFLLVLAIISCETGISKANSSEPIMPVYENMTCSEILELYTNFAVLYKISDIRIKAVKTAPSRELWSDIRLFTIQTHPGLQEAKNQKCKAA